MTADIRAVALGAVRRNDELLVFEEQSPDTGEPYYRLLGGGVEFGEHSSDAVVREFDEELGVTFTEPMDLGTFEQVFSYDREPAHELWRVYEGSIVEDWPYEEDSFTFVEPELGIELLACWMSIERLRDDDITFYVSEVLDAVTR
ncbi:NUDIX hydrolase [Halorhabdus salina]|uniref:NUDIX hydrolase n=1 Tax=Halorhabdus salina TaxID=2750670 RepID=UPI0015EED175|nr:NUDIX domain-containing protein [Halorhabdus salina]